MKCVPTPFKGVFEIELEPIRDERGWFSRVFCKREFEGFGFREEFVQINHSRSEDAGTFRGFHYQTPPHAETKLIRCVAGQVLDIIVDLRRGSETFLRSYSVVLSSRNQKMILVPEGFAHGFYTLEPGCELIYQHTQYYEKGAERVIRYDDPMISVRLPGAISTISDRDANAVHLLEGFKGIAI